MNHKKVIEDLMDYFIEKSEKANDREMLEAYANIVENALNAFPKYISNVVELQNASLTKRPIMDTREWQDYAQPKHDACFQSLDSCKIACDRLNRYCKEANLPAFFEGDSTYSRQVQNFAEKFVEESYEVCLDTVLEVKKEFEF